ncbi:MAG: 4Fe-4S cluster-binding domain-containing protein [Planctomycetes bacterium]|nr:4Fe-4S cluster-binding domain-containing protein [Planctomycetota bacterium]
MNIIINSIDYKGSIAEGPGIRTVLFLQGCDQRCEGCHNAKTWDTDKGKPVQIIDLANEIRQNTVNANLTISGGEPLMQVPAILELLNLLNDFNVALYTGCELEEVPKELLQRLDYIKVGKYDKEKHCTTIDYIGSTNQRFIDLRRGR